jgi:hypothetical protein
MRKIILILGSSVLGIALVLAGTWWWAVTHIDLSGVRIDKTNVSQVVKQVDTISRAVRDGSIPTRKVDFSSVGQPEKESELLSFRYFLPIYLFAFGSSPADAPDLRRLLSLANLNANQRKLVERDSRDCVFFPFAHDSYLINCDGWHSATADTLESLVARFDTETEKFYVIEGHVFLYAPQPVARPR